MISLYGIIISISIIACIAVAQHLVKKEERDFIWELAFWAIIGGVIGARIYHVIDYLEYYANNPIQIIAVWNGGLGIWGALFGGLLSSYLFLKKEKKSIGYWLSIISVTAPLGQSIGRWGNFFNKELLGKQDQPLFFYESILNFSLFAILFVLFKKLSARSDLKENGVFVYMYLIGYSLIRFNLENLRQRSWEIYGLNVAQSISIMVVVFSIAQLIMKGIKK